MNTSLPGLERAGILSAKTARPTSWPAPNLSPTWDPLRNTRTLVWEVTQHLMKRLDEGGDPAAGALLRQVGGLSDAARDLAYRLYVCERRNWSAEGQAYNSLVTAWPELAPAGSR